MNTNTIIRLTLSVIITLVLTEVQSQIIADAGIDKVVCVG